MAGNIGIVKVQDAAAKLEKAIRESDASVPALLAELESTLTPLVRAIRVALGEPAPAEAPKGAFDSKAAAVAVARLKSLIEANDGDAADAVQQVADALAGRIDARRLAALRGSVDEFDFDGALAKLGEIASECNLSLG